MVRIVAWMSCLVLVVAVGCGKQEAAPTNAGTSQGGAAQVAKANGPEATVAEFLEAVRTGNDEKAGKLLSTVARQKTAALNRSVTPPASDTAKFSVGSVDYVGDDGARVSCAWTDVDADGQPKTDHAIWVCRREAEGWRIAGVAAQVFPGEEPLVLNFEDPEDMLRQQQWVREEIRRRMQKEEAAHQAQASGNDGQGALPRDDGQEVPAQAKKPENPSQQITR